MQYRPNNELLDFIQTDNKTRQYIASLIVKLLRMWKIKLSDAKYILLMPQQQSLRVLFDTEILLLNGQLYIILDLINIYKTLRSYYTQTSQFRFMHRKMYLMDMKPQSIVEFWTDSKDINEPTIVDLKVVSKIRAIADFLTIHQGLLSNEPIPANWKDVLLRHQT